MTDVDIVSHGAVEEPVEDTQSPQTPESPEEDEDDDDDDDDEEDTDTDDGAFGGDEDVDGSQFVYHNNRHPNLYTALFVQQVLVTG